MAFTGVTNAHGLTPANLGKDPGLSQGLSLIIVVKLFTL